MISFNLRIRNAKTWAKFKILAARSYLSANSLLNQLIENHVKDEKK